MYVNSQFPNIDQIKRASRDEHYIHEHEFSEKATILLDDIKKSVKALLDESNNEHVLWKKRDEFNTKKLDLTKKINELEAEINEKINGSATDLSKDYIVKANKEIETIFEKLKTLITEFIKIQNVNLINYINTFDLMDSYVLIMKDFLKNKFYKKNNGKFNLITNTINPNKIHNSSKGLKNIILRVVDKENSVSIPFILNPKENADSYFELCRINPCCYIDNLDSIPSKVEEFSNFLLNLNITSDLFNFKGRVLPKNNKIVFEADSQYNNDHHITFKIFKKYNRNNISDNYIVLAFKYNKDKDSVINFVNMKIDIDMVIGNSLDVSNTGKILDMKELISEETDFPILNIINLNEWGGINNGGGDYDVPVP